MAWDGSNRRSRLPDDWPAIRQRVKRRAKGKCEATTHARGCDGTGNQCDHITPGDNHSLGNLQWLSEPCHKAKTARDNATNRAALAAQRKRKPEKHPGSL